MIAFKLNSIDKQIIEFPSVVCKFNKNDIHLKFIYDLRASATSHKNLIQLKFLQLILYQ